MQKPDSIDIKTLNEIANTIQAKKYGYEYPLKINTELTHTVEDIFKNKSIIFFESSNSSHFHELDDIFSAYVSNLTSSYFSNRQVDDEISLIKSSYHLEPTFLENKQLEFTKVDRRAYPYVKGVPATPDFFGKYSVPEKDFFYWAKESKNIQRVDNNKLPASIIFATSKIMYNDQSKIALSIIDVDRRNESYALAQLFLFNANEYDDMESSPIRLFLKIIDYYAINITVKGITKRFWEYIEVSNYMDSLSSEIRFNSKLKPFMNMTLLHSQFADKIVFMYGINYKDYFNDLKEGVI